MQTLLWAGLAANALAHLRYAVLQVQDGEDRVKAGDRDAGTTIHWADNSGLPYLAFRVLASPVLTAYTIGKYMLFPRGIKSKFAREQEAKAHAEALLQAERDKEDELNAQLKEAHILVSVWNPGEFMCPEPDAKPEPVALGWHHAADEFDAHAAHIKATAGQPWIHPAPPRKRTGARVLVDAGSLLVDAGIHCNNDRDEE